jgi:hypothetical protein
VEPRRVAIEKQNLGASVVQVGVNIVLLRNGGSSTVIEEPKNLFGAPNRPEWDLIADTDSIDEVVKAVMKKIIAIAPAFIRRTNPD